MSLTIYQVDAFTSVPFKGNPAGVCILDGPAGEEWMQSVALEMNLAETAFLYRSGERYNLRWFTPTVEVDLCGHATLASAHVLWETGLLAHNCKAEFDTRSGLLTAWADNGAIEMDFPKDEEKECDLPVELGQALGVKPLYTGRATFDYILELESENAVEGLKPDFDLLKKVPMRGVMVTSLTDSDKYDFVSRFFAPSAGINEDHATGSAHCCLGPYWEKRLGKKELRAYQASPRGGELSVRTKGDRVVLGGNAVTVLRCELIV